MLCHLSTIITGESTTISLKVEMITKYQHDVSNLSVCPQSENPFKKTKKIIKCAPYDSSNLRKELNRKEN